MTDEINPETKQYLENIANKVEMYHNAKDLAAQYLINKKIKNRKKIENCILMSQVWVADSIGETITFGDIMIYLGSSEIEPFENDNEEITLTPDIKGKTLTKLLDIVVQADGNFWEDDNS